MDRSPIGRDIKGKDQPFLDRNSVRKADPFSLLSDFAEVYRFSLRFLCREGFISSFDTNFLSKAAAREPARSRFCVTAAQSQHLTKIPRPSAPGCGNRLTLPLQSATISPKSIQPAPYSGPILQTPHAAAGYLHRLRK